MNLIEFGDCRDIMRRWAADGVRAQTCVTSPPYFGLRDYGHPGQLGLEQTPEQYVAAMVEVFQCVRDVLADDGTLWLNIGDTYAGYHGNKNAAYDAAPSNKGGYFENKRKTLVNHNGIKNKDLIGIPWMLAFALRADGWYLRQDIIWHKPNPMPESVRDRCTKAHEYVFLLSKSERYFFDSEAMKEPAKEWHGRAATFDRSGNAVADHIILGQNAAQHRPRPSVKRGEFNGKTNAMPGREAFRAVTPTRNRRSVWTVATRPYKGAHFATFPPALIEPCILAGSRHGDIVLDPFMGSGTTAAVALQHGRQYLGCELNHEYGSLQAGRISKVRGEIEGEQLSRMLDTPDLFAEVA